MTTTAAAARPTHVLVSRRMRTPGESPVSGRPASASNFVTAAGTLRNCWASAARPRLREARGTGEAERSEWADGGACGAEARAAANRTPSNSRRRPAQDDERAVVG